MKHLVLFVLVAIAVTASAALAAPPGQSKSPAQLCKSELATLGAANFKSLYAPGGSGANAMGKCVSKHARAAAANRSNAAKSCQAELAMPEAEFRAAHGGMSFARVLRQEPQRQERVRQVRLLEGARRQCPAGSGDDEGGQGLQGGARGRPRGIHREVRRQGCVGLRQVRLVEEQEAVSQVRDRSENRRGEQQMRRFRQE